MDLADFVDMLRRLGPDDLVAVSHAIDQSHRTAADEVTAWEDLMHIDDALRRRGRSRVAARAARDAIAAVRQAVAAAPVEVSDVVVTRVAREAALLARAMVADVTDAVEHLEREFACAVSY
jgi:nicotinamide mononucleotide adenylyltransferase